MKTETVLCLGGMDPSGGAGLLADIKTLHQFGVQGFGVTTAITYQNETSFSGLDWLSVDQIKSQLVPLMKYYQHIKVVKVGMIESLDVLSEALDFLQKHVPGVKIVWDPVLRASAGFDFHPSLEEDLLREVLRKVDVLTPNMPEAEVLARVLGSEPASPPDRGLAGYMGLSAMILKGGHDEGEQSEDVLYRAGQPPFPLRSQRLEGRSIHGSGCVFASAFSAGLALGHDAEEAFAKAKNYVFQLLKVSETPLGKHHLVK